MVEEKAMKQTVFIVIILAVVLAVFIFLQFQQLFVGNLFWIVVVLVVLALVAKFDYIIMLQDYERAVIFRFGRIKRVGGPGWTGMLPPIEHYTKVDLRTRTIDIPKQDVITKDNIEVKIDAVIYLRVKKDSQSVINSVVEVEDFIDASRLLVIAEIRDVIGSMTMPELLSKVEELNQKLKEKLQAVSEKWGISVVAVQLTEVLLPRTVIDAMHLEKAAVQEKLARMEKAEAEKAEIAAIRQATETLSDKALAYYYIKALEEMSKGQATKIIFPLELTKLTEALSGRIGGKGLSPELIEKYAPLLVEALGEAEKPKKKKKK